MTAPDGAAHGRNAEPRRREDARLLRGAARYVDDVRLDGMLEGVFIRSPYAHARIRGIDASAALAAGAKLVLTAADLPFSGKPWVTRYWSPAIRGGLPGFLASDRARFVGDPVAFLVAADRYRAEDIAPLVEIDWEPLQPLPDAAAAMAPGAPRLHEGWEGNVAASFEHRLGDPDAALARAAHRVRGRYAFARQTPVTLECRGIVADYDVEREELTAWMSTQAHYNVRQNLSQILDLPESQVRVICEDVGGGFGAKSRTYAEEIVVSHASRVLRRPVKWIEDRMENLQATTHSRAVEVELELGCDADGRFTGLKAEVQSEIGGYVFTSGIMTTEIAAVMLTGGYRIMDFEIRARAVGVNKTPIATYRGAGMPEATFPLESLVDALAAEAGLSAAAIRARNLIRPADLPHDLGRKLGELPLVVESGDLPAVLDLGLALSGYEEGVSVLADGRREAWGLAMGMEASGVVNFETANVRIDAAGRVTVLSGMTTQGQGQLTTFAQVCAEALGARFEDVRVKMGDTALMPFGRGAFASRGAIQGASAVHLAALKLKARALEIAGALLQVPPAALDLAGGRVLREGAATGLGLGDLARAVAPGGPLHAGEAALEANHLFDAENPITFGGTAHAARVRLDLRTGVYEVVDYVISHDGGRLLNRMIAEGQIVGGAVDGIGGATLSELVYDDEAQLLTGSLADYLVAGSLDAPRIRLGEIETRAGTNPLGVRGIGEGSVNPVGAAIANALARAMGADAEARGPLARLPLKPERVREACRLSARGRAA